MTPGWADLDRGLFSISVAAELAGLHPQTLRIYEREGLLDPARSAGGTRRYSRRDIDRLAEICALTADGLNLAGIRRVLQLQEETRQSAGRAGPAAGARRPAARRAAGPQTAPPHRQRGVADGLAGSAAARPSRRAAHVGGRSERARRPGHLPGPGSAARRPGCIPGMTLSTRKAGAAFADLICDDPQWLDAEFDALISASFGEPPAPPRVPPRPGIPCPPSRRPSPGPTALTSPATGPDHGRQRSPPAYPRPATGHLPPPAERRRPARTALSTGQTGRRTGQDAIELNLSTAGLPRGAPPLLVPGSQAPASERASTPPNTWVSVSEGSGWRLRECDWTVVPGHIALRPAVAYGQVKAEEMTE